MTVGPPPQDQVHWPSAPVPVSRRRRVLDLLAGFILGLLTLSIMVWMALHLMHTDQVDARRVGLPLPVQAVAAKVQPISMSVGASGTLAALNPLTLIARVNSRVQTVPVDLGDVVKTGDLLVKLDDALFKATLESARTASIHADKALHRMETLEARGYGAPSATEEARANAAAAQEAVVQAEVALDETVTKAPVSSVILNRNVNPGEITALDEPLFVLGPIEKVDMVAEVSTDKTGYVTLGTPAEVSVDSFPGEVFRGQVVKIDARAVVTTRTFGAYIRIANPDLRLKPGVTGYARFVKTHTALAIPSVAVLNPVGDKATVIVVDSGSRARIREIRPGIMADGMTEVLDGLQKGERVVTVGQLELRDGDRVSVNISGPWMH